MNTLFNPKFELDDKYTRDDFIFRLEAIKATDTTNNSLLLSTIDKNIAWAAEHSPDTIISWYSAPNGTLYPVATASASFEVLPKDTIS
jgi:hypothetical protein